MTSNNRIIISEEELDAILTGEDLPELTSASGCNIKTGCYGLFLIAMDQCSNPEDKTLLESAISKLESIHDDTMMVAMLPCYPPADLSYQGLLKMARVIIKIEEVTQGRNPYLIDPDEGEALETNIREVLNISYNLTEGEDEPNNTPRNRGTVH
jgi:hypothetical protein